MFDAAASLIVSPTMVIPQSFAIATRIVSSSAANLNVYLYSRAVLTHCL